MPRGNPFTRRSKSKNTGESSRRNEETQSTPTQSPHLEDVPQTPETHGSQPQTPPSSIPQLDPDGLWFEEEEVKGAITAAIQGFYEKPWRNYTEVDDATKNHWFYNFSRSFRWRDELDAAVRRNFDKYCIARLRGMFYAVTKKSNKRPQWIDEDVYSQMFDVLKTDDKYIRRSEQNKKNRRGGSMDNPVEATHFQGSISTVQHVRKLAAKNKGILPSAADVFRHTHFKEVPNVGRVPANRHVQHIEEEYERLQAQTPSSDDGSQLSPNDLFYEATGGRNKKGRVRGLGKGADLYYANTARGKGSASQYSQPIISQVQQQMQTQLEEQRVQMESTMDARLQAQREQLQADFEARMQAEREHMEQLLRQFSGMTGPTCSNIPPQYRDPRNDDDGSSGAGNGIPVFR